MGKQNNLGKYLGLWITDNLSHEKHIKNITGDTYQLLRDMRMPFKYLDEEMIKDAMKYTDGFLLPK